MFARLRRKLADVREYPALAATAADRRDLWALGLWRTRLVGAARACHLTRGRQAVITPRLRATHGEPVRITIGDYSELDCFDELFVERIYDLGAVPFAPDLVVDCGGFRGYFSALAAGRFPHATLVCFEPNPEHQAALRAQLDLLSRPVELIAAAIGPTDSTVAFAGHGMGGAVVAGADARRDAHAVPQVAFSRWLAARRPQRLVWKLDVEGAEIDVLPAALSQLPPQTALFLETHFNDHRCAQLLAPYRAAGFSVHEVRRRPAGDIAYIEWLLLRQQAT